MLQCRISNAAMQTNRLPLASGIHRLLFKDETAILTILRKGTSDVRVRRRRAPALQLSDQPPRGRDRPPVDGERRDLHPQRRPAAFRPVRAAARRIVAPSLNLPNCYFR